MKLLLLFFLSYSLYSAELLGKHDRFDLPELHIKNIRAKIDTGAQTSSLHCVSIEELKNGYVRFILLDPKSTKFTGKYIKKKIHRTGLVRSSNGIQQKRYFIKTPIVIYGVTYMMEVSLNFRGSMKFPLLIGTELLRQNFLVDVTKKNLSYKFKLDNKMPVEK